MQDAANINLLSMKITLNIKAPLLLVLISTYKDPILPAITLLFSSFCLQNNKVIVKKGNTSATKKRPHVIKTENLLEGESVYN